MPQNKRLIKRRGERTVGDDMENIAQIMSDWFIFFMRLFCYFTILGFIMGFGSFHHVFYGICEWFKEAVQR